VGEAGCSWAHFAEDIFKTALKRDITKNKPKISKISTSKIPNPAKRPMQSQLDCSKLKSTFGIYQPNYADGIYSSLDSYGKVKYKK